MQRLLSDFFLQQNSHAFFSIIVFNKGLLLYTCINKVIRRKIQVYADTSQDLSQLSLVYNQKIRSDETINSQEHSAQQKGNFSVIAK